MNVSASSERAERSFCRCASNPSSSSGPADRGGPAQWHTGRAGFIEQRCRRDSYIQLLRERAKAHALGSRAHARHRQHQFRQGRCDSPRSVNIAQPIRLKFTISARRRMVRSLQRANREVRTERSSTSARERQNVGRPNFGVATVLDVERADRPTSEVRMLSNRRRYYSDDAMIPVPGASKKREKQAKKRTAAADRRGAESRAKEMATGSDKTPSKTAETSSRSEQPNAKPRNAKKHSASVKAGESKNKKGKATHELESSNPEKRPSRKSTRGGANHAKADSQLKNRQTRAVRSPKARSSSRAG